MFVGKFVYSTAWKFVYYNFLDIYNLVLTN